MVITNQTEANSANNPLTPLTTMSTTTGNNPTQPAQGNRSPPKRKRRCCCTLQNEKPFQAVPLLALVGQTGWSLSELVYLLTLTGFWSLDIIGLSAIMILLALTLAAVLYIRFVNRLAPLAFLMVCLSFLSTSTYFATVVHDLEAQQAPFPDHGTTRFDTMRFAMTPNAIFEIQNKQYCCGYWNYTDWLYSHSSHRILKQGDDYPEGHQGHAKINPIEGPQVDSGYNVTVVLYLDWLRSCCNRNQTSSCHYPRMGMQLDKTVQNILDEISHFLHDQGCASHLEEKLKDIQDYKFRSCWSLVFWDLILSVNLLTFACWRRFRKPEAKPRRRVSSNKSDNNDDDVFT